MTPPTQDTNGRNGSAIRRDPLGRTEDHPGFNPFDNPAVAAKHAAEREATAAHEKRLTRWAPTRFALGELQTRPEPWARNIVRATARFNAGADPVKGLPTLMIAGDKLILAGATDAELTGLHALTPPEIAALQLEAAAFREAQRTQVRTLARKIAADRETTVAAPEPRSLTALLDEPDEGPSYRFDGLWPTGGRVLLAAQYKAGKSTMVGNTTKSLVDGSPFMDTFDVTPVEHVALIDTELDPRTLRRWLREQGIERTDAVTVLPLRGAVSTFDILDPATRSEWARRLAGADVVILDCLRPVLDALGLSEDKDAGRVLVAFDALLAEIGASEGLVVTHMGHQNGPASERARGDSRLLDWPDALWKIVRDGDETDDDGNRHRYFSAMGRDVAVSEGVVKFDAATRHLTFGTGGRKEAGSSAAMPLLLEMVSAAPGELSKRQLESNLTDDHGLRRQDVRSAISRAIKSGLVTVKEGPRRAQLLSPGSVDAFTAPLLGTPVSGPDSDDSEGE